MLERAAGQPTRDPRPFPVRHLGGLVALGAGLLSLIVASFLQFGGDAKIDEPPSPLVTVPFLLVTLGGLAAMLLRKEPHRVIGYVGLGMAAAAVALGWVLVAAAVGAGAVIVCLIVQHLF